MKRFENKVAVITGAASGIGAATARLMAREGAHVVLADIGDEGGRSLARDLGPTALAVKCDVSKQADVDALIRAAVDSHGRIDILFNNAGIGSYGTSDMGKRDRGGPALGVLCLPRRHPAYATG